MDTPKRHERSRQFNGVPVLLSEREGPIVAHVSQDWRTAYCVACGLPDGLQSVKHAEVYHEGLFRTVQLIELVRWATWHEARACGEATPEDADRSAAVPPEAWYEMRCENCRMILWPPIERLVSRELQAIFQAMETQR